MLSNVLAIALVGMGGMTGVLAQTTSTAPTFEGLQILSPGGPDVWWVAQSQNTLSWTCDTSTITNFTVLIANSNPAILTSPQAFFAQENNFVCSQTITPDTVNQQPATGYTIQFANPFNESDVYVSSLPFEIKAFGSTYPAPSATPVGPNSASVSPSGSSSPSSSGSSGAPAPSSSGSGGQGSNGALSMKGVSGLVGFAAAVVGLVLA